MSDLWGLHEADNPTIPSPFGEDTNIVHRMVGWDLPYVMRSRGHTPESVAEDLKRDPEGTAHRIFTNIEDEYQGVGQHWTRNPAMANYIADVKGDKHAFHVVFSGTHEPSDVNADNDDLTGGEWPEEEHEPRLHHSDILTEDGRGWSEYEQSRQKSKTAGKNGPLPPLTFEPFNTMWSNGIMARHAEDGRPVGHLHWVPNGEIDSITVHPELQRRGIGKAMLDHARNNPDQYPSTYPIFHSQHLTKAGRAWAAQDGHTLPDEQVYAADDDPKNWGFTAVENYVPVSQRYNGENEDEMSNHLEQPWTPPRTASTGFDDGWPVWWRGKHRPAGDFDERWSPNHPQRIPAPWEN